MISNFDRGFPGCFIVFLGKGLSKIIGNDVLALHTFEFFEFFDFWWLIFGFGSGDQTIFWGLNIHQNHGFLAI